MIRRSLLSACLFAACSISLGQTTGGSERAAVQELTPEQLSAMMGSSTVFILDCNEKDNYDWAHVPGARLIEYDRITTDILPSDMDAILVFYCYSPECPAAAMAAASAAQLGYRNVYCMTAGIIGWQDTGLPTEP